MTKKFAIWLVGISDAPNSFNLSYFSARYTIDVFLGSENNFTNVVSDNPDSMESISLRMESISFCGDWFIYY